LLSRICPGPGVWWGGTISPPVVKWATRGRRADERLDAADPGEQSQGARVQTDARLLERLAGLRIFSAKADVGRAVVFQEADVVAMTFHMFLHDHAQTAARESGSGGHADGLAGLKRARFPIRGVERVNNLKCCRWVVGQNGVAVARGTVKRRRIFQGGKPFRARRGQRPRPAGRDGGQRLAAGPDFPPSPRRAKRGRRAGRVRAEHCSPGLRRRATTRGASRWDVLFDSVHERVQQGKGLRAMAGGDADVNGRFARRHDADAMDDAGGQAGVARREGFQQPPDFERGHFGVGLVFQRGDGLAAFFGAG